jgi:hypothetical protein
MRAAQNTMEGYLYLVKSLIDPHWKIGISRNLHNRLRAIPEEIDFDCSYYVECRKPSRKIEQALHLLFSDYRIDKPRSSQAYTEWFDVQCFESARRFIADYGEMLGVGELRPIPKDTRVATPVVLQSLAASAEALSSEGVGLGKLLASMRINPGRARRRPCSGPCSKSELCDVCKHRLADRESKRRKVERA